MGDHISYSEIRTFERCKRLHNYTYVQGYEPKREADELSTGRWMHELLAAHYKTPSLYIGGHWDEYHSYLTEQALEAALFEEEREAIHQRADLIEGVMRRYTARFSSERWEPVFFEDEPLVEREILIPLPSGGTLKIRVDLVARDLDSGLIWVWDHKTRKEFDRDMEARLDFDPQLSLYTLGLRALGINVVGGMHNYIRMRLPGEPKVNKDGTMSKVQLITDEETVRSTIARTGAKISDEDLGAYLDKLPKDAFFRRYTTIREEHELAATVAELELKLRERELARREGLTTRTLIADCLHCPFHDPCIVALKGGDEALILVEKYRKREAETPLEYAEGGEA